MNEAIAAKTFLYSIDAVVFGVLGFLLWIFYRGFSRQYVKLWMLSLLFLSTNQVISAIDSRFLLLPDTTILKVVLELGIQATFYLYLTFLVLGLYVAKKDHNIRLNNMLIYTGITIAFASTVTLTCAFDQGYELDRLFLRETLKAFITGILLSLATMFLIWQKQQYFSSRIFTYVFLVYAVESFIYSLSSMLAISEPWFPYLVSFSQYFDIGVSTVIAFSMIVWMQGAERNKAETALTKAQYLGQHDSLTGSLNRVQVLEQLPQLMEDVRKNQQKLCVLLIDIKRFKFINDTYGLKIGDHILGEIANRLKGSIFKPSLVGRLSGDSFVLSIEYHDENQIAHILTHIHELIGRPFGKGGQEIQIQCSVGYCSFPDYAESAEEMLQNANLALFQAESNNIASVGYSHDMQVQGRHLLEMEREIKAGLQNSEFELYFQPQLNLLTNRLEGVEALIRWNHPERGFLTPNHFLPDVETLGLNSEFDIYVLEKACQTHKRWSQQYKKRVAIAINITAVEFQDPKLISTIQQLLLKYEISPKYIELEITENVVMTDLRSAMDTIVILQNMGIKVSIDDFGTGYSSLAYLRQLPIDKIKIDRSFINEMASNDSDITIVNSMIKLSHGLGKRVLAEGVETQTQLDMLRKLGCDAVQGYFISKPISETDLAKYLTR